MHICGHIIEESIPISSEKQSWNDMLRDSENMGSSLSRKERNVLSYASEGVSERKSKYLRLRSRNKMKRCMICQGPLKEEHAKMPDGVPYTFYRCRKCGNEVLDMEQLHAVAEKYRILKKYHIKLSRWGVSLGLRIPKEVAKQYGFGEGQEVLLIPEKEGVKLIPIEK